MSFTLGVFETVTKRIFSLNVPTNQTLCSKKAAMEAHFKAHNITHRAGLRPRPLRPPPTRGKAQNLGGKLIYLKKKIWRYRKKKVLYFSSSFKKSQKIE